MADIDDTIDDLCVALAGTAIRFEPVDGDILITQGYLSELLEFCRDWRSEIEELE